MTARFHRMHRKPRDSPGITGRKLKWRRGQRRHTHTRARAHTHTHTHTHTQGQRRGSLTKRFKGILDLRRLDHLYIGVDAVLDAEVHHLLGAVDATNQGPAATHMFRGDDHILSKMLQKTHLRESAQAELRTRSVPGDRHSSEEEGGAGERERLAGKADQHMLSIGLECSDVR